MTDRIHDDEPDTSESVVRALLETECPQWAASPLDDLRTSGTDNAMWRVRLVHEPDLVVRLPRRPGAAAGVEQEDAVLRHIETSSIRSIVQTPSVRHSGRPHDLFPHHWSILGWLDGVDAWTVRDRLDIDALDSLTEDLAHVVAAIGEMSSIDVRRRSPGSRGGPLGPLLERLDGWLSSPEWNAAALVDVAAIRRLAAEAVEIIDEPVEEGFVHGDLIPGNLLVDGRKLTAVHQSDRCRVATAGNGAIPTLCRLTFALLGHHRITIGEKHTDCLAQCFCHLFRRSVVCERGSERVWQRTAHGRSRPPRSWRWHHHGRRHADSFECHRTDRFSSGDPSHGPRCRRQTRQRVVKAPLPDYPAEASRERT